MRRTLLCVGIAFAMLAVPASAQRLSVTESVHNLSPGGPGTVKASTGYACLFCHAPHNVQAEQTPLWNQQLSTQIYTPYASSSYRQTAQQIEIGSPSKLCLSCHDGTVALGQTLSAGPIPLSGALSSKTNLGTDLRSSHPFSFTAPFADNGELRTTLFNSPPQTADPLVKLVNNRVECTTCHEPHTPNLDPAKPKFLVRDASNGQLCMACHDPDRPTATYLRGWTTGQHALAAHSTSGNPALGGYATVAANSCSSCHVSHNTGSGGRLLRATEEATCAACHSGQNLSPALPDVTGSFERSAYKHPVNLTGLHDPTENALPLNASRHAECADCHNAHAVQAGSGSPTPPAAGAALSGVAGVSVTDGATPVAPAANQYEVCFKCHANSTNKPQSGSYVDYGRTPYRANFPSVADPYNVRLEFQSQVARHNVTQSARGGVAPSLRANILDLNGNPAGRSLAPGTYLYCTDCHNNDAARASGGTAANGPHGSRYNHILERRYDFEPEPAAPGGSTTGVSYASGLSGPYALCDKCHDVDAKILQEDSVFGKHRRHVVNASASCATCHAPHGIQGGSSTQNRRLLNFDLKIVGPNRNGQLQSDTGARTCSLECHGKDHNSSRY